ncbi:aliphatic sulfonate ABC transporter substrate-binding protein [Kocuria coralli]|uniref:Putative aliphatic sulfonates-binding protein n=1 Tax=Kocuria coralli TaxID=1461025 RepID=A0A5J5KW39_9MICC|nr:aliphatic sulfonate ABC transporter substrate-binding protein [Kocuria coralli]KAA9393480.1 aliphatic sulfonate ABC transporter substrate-binding protein [Kocuria coralli]
MADLSRRNLLRATGLGAATLALSGCMAGEGAGTGVANADSAGSITLDYATYNPLSLIIRSKGWLEKVADGIGQSVEWVNSAGSNKANEYLRAGVIDVGSTAGSAALLARANGSPIKVIDIFSQPEWSALVKTPDSDIDSVADLKGASIAATLGTDPYFLLLQALETAGLSADDVSVQNLQHADGRTALDTGQVDAWAGLDPIMAAAEEGGDLLFYRNLDFNTYGFLNARESFLTQNPTGAHAVVNTYAYAREWALAHEEEAVTILGEEAGIEPGTAQKVWERTHLDIDPVPGDDQIAVLENIGPILVESGDVSSQENVDDALASIVEKSYAEAADRTAVAGAIEGN